MVAGSGPAGFRGGVLFDVQGKIVDGPRGAISTVSTANATDLTTAQALANQLKTTLNAVITQLKADGIIS